VSRVARGSWLWSFGLWSRVVLSSGYNVDAEHVNEDVADRIGLRYHESLLEAVGPAVFVC
jgi:hypothetical protein